jgi:type I restriction enzyme M protein
VVLFFEKGAPARKVWYYKPNLTQTLGKTNPLTDDHLRDFLALQAKFKNSENSWTIDLRDIDTATYDLSVKNPNKSDETALRDPKDIIAEMTALDAESAEILAGIGGML